MMTLLEAADRIGVTPSNLRAAIKRGSLVAYKRGRDWLVETEEVDRYARQNMYQPPRRRVRA